MFYFLFIERINENPYLIFASVGSDAKKFIKEILCNDIVDVDIKTNIYSKTDTV